MRARFFISIIALLLPLSLHAQLRRQVSEKEARPTAAKERVQKKTVFPRQKDVREPDTVYCMSAIKQYGWFKPHGIIDRETAKHCNYILFTRKNTAGHWTKLETFNSYGKHKSLGSRPYILTENDPLADRNWLKKIENCCVIEIVADPTGNEVFQERVYDEDMNLIYSFSHTPIGERKYIGSYKDIYGLPAEMRRDSAYTYGTLVVITEDKWGYDSIIEYVDAKGVPKNNSNEVGAMFQVHDKEGRLIRSGSANHDGTPVMDNWGNCGAERVYDKDAFFPRQVTNMDSNWRPDKLPNKRKEAYAHAGVERYIRKYDKYWRVIEEEFVTAANKPDTNLYGVHKEVYEYNDHGDGTLYENFGLDGQLATNQWGISRGVNQYDSLGRLVDVYYYGKGGELESRPGRRYREQTVYGDSGRYERIYFGLKDGRTDTLYYYSRNKERTYAKYSDDIIEIDSVDETGYTYYTAYFNHAMEPYFYDGDGFHKRVRRIIPQGKLVKYVTECWDEHGNHTPTNPFWYNLIDTIAKKRLTCSFDGQMRLYETYIQDYLPYGQIGKQYDVNAFGVVCRSGGSGRVRCYYGDVMYSQKGEFSSFIGRDEFGEPDYFYGVNENGVCSIYYYLKFAKGVKKAYHEDNEEITDVLAFRNACPKAMSIEVTDSAAYALGLKDNDIILRYGDSYQLVDTVGYWDFIGDWSVAQMFEAAREKKLLVFRIDPETKAYGVVEISLPKGNPSDLGFIAHITFKTRKQRARIQESLARYQQECEESGIDCLWKQRVEPWKDQSIVVAFADMFRANRYQPYPLQVTDPSVILACDVPAQDSHWLFGQNAESLLDILTQRKSAETVPPMTLYYIKNGSVPENSVFTEQVNGFAFFNYKVSQSQYDYLKKQYKLADKQRRKKHVK